MTTIIILAIAQVLEFLPALGAALKGLSEKTFGKLLVKYIEDYRLAWESLDEPAQSKIENIKVSLAPDLNLSLGEIYRYGLKILESVEILDENLTYLGKSGLGYLDENVKSSPNNIEALMKVLKEKELTK